MRFIAALLLVFLSSVVIASLVSFLAFSAFPYLLLIVPVGLGIWWYLKRPSLYQAAQAIERADLKWKDRLSTAVDLSAKHNPREVYSHELTCKYIEGIEKRLLGHKLPALNGKKALIASSGILGTSFLIGLILALITFTRLSFGAIAVFAPHNLDLEIEALTPDTLINPGQYLEVAAEVKAPIDIRYVYVEQNGAETKKRRKVKVEDGIAQDRIKVAEEQSIRFFRLGRGSEIYAGLVEAFEIRQVEFTVTPPAYSGEKPRAFRGLRLSALAGSVVALDGQASCELRKALIAAGDSSIPLEVEGRSFKGSFELGQLKSAGIILTNRTGAKLEERIALNLRPDETPLVEVFLPGKDMDVNRSMSLTLGVHALDDYGLGRVNLVSTGAAEVSLPLPVPAGRIEDTVLYRWDLNDLALLPGEEIVYYVEASDNDAVSGPKWGRSKSFRLRFPDISEMFSEVTSYGEETAGELSRLSSEQEELSRDLSRIEEKLRAEQNLSTEEQEYLRELISQEENLLSSIDSLAEETRELLEKMEQGLITEPETLEKLSALSEMLSELMPPELAEKLAQLSQTLGEDPQRLADILKNTSEMNLDLENQLEQALGVLERFLQEQRLEELAEKAEALADMEAELIREEDQLTPPQAAARQQEIEKGLEELAQEASELASELEDTELAQELRELANQMAGENTELSQQVKSSLNSGKMDKQSARKLERNLRQAGIEFAQLNQNLKQNRNQALQQEMAKLIRELLLLSEEQEDLIGRIGTEADLELAAQVTELERSLDRKKEDVFKLASKSFKIPRSAMQNLSTASRNQTTFKQSLIEGRKSTASNQGRSVQHEIDKAAAALLEAMAQACGQSCSSTGLDDLMQALSQMSLAQLSINQQMGGLFPLPISTDRMSAAQRQALGEMLAQQAALRKQLEELAKAAGQEPGLSGMLEGIIEEMRRLEEDLSKYVGEREVVERGEHVFRRLLDARNVLRKKDETPEREREIGMVWENLESPTPPQDMGERNLWLKKELVRFLRSDYPEEYKRLARAYLETLLEQE